MTPVPTPKGVLDAQPGTAHVGVALSFCMTVGHALARPRRQYFTRDSTPVLINNVRDILGCVFKCQHLLDGVEACKGALAAALSV